MTVPFYYTVKAKLIRFIKNGEIDFLEFSEKFEHENPILAREMAFRYYQNYIDILLQAKGKEYISDSKAREELVSFYDPGTLTKIKFNEHEFELSDSFGNGIGVYMVINIPIKDEPMPDKEGSEYQIHGIGNMGREDPQGLMDGLNQEIEYYNYYNLDTKKYRITVDFYEYDIEESEKNEILKTPFDWTGYNVPFYDKIDNASAKKSKRQTAKTFDDLINEGENNQVEFKTNLLYYHDKEGSKDGYRMFVRHIIAKVICSFLNSNGGYLFVGVSDKKEIQGLKDDFSLARPKGKDPKDYFTLEVDKIIRDYFKDFASNIYGEFTEIKGIEIFVITVFPSKNRPVFIKGLNGKEFYVRYMGSCEPYTDIEQITSYCIEKWGNKELK